MIIALVLVYKTTELAFLPHFEQVTPGLQIISRSSGFTRGGPSFSPFSLRKDKRTLLNNIILDVNHARSFAVTA